MKEFWKNLSESLKDRHKTKAVLALAAMGLISSALQVLSEYIKYKQLLLKHNQRDLVEPNYIGLWFGLICFLVIVIAIVHTFWDSNRNKKDK